MPRDLTDAPQVARVPVHLPAPSPAPVGQLGSSNDPSGCSWVSSATLGGLGDPVLTTICHQHLMLGEVNLVGCVSEIMFSHL